MLHNEIVYLRIRNSSLSETIGQSTVLSDTDVCMCPSEKILRPKQKLT